MNKHVLIVLECQTLDCVPEGEWYCDRCVYLKDHKDEVVVCCQCGQEGSAFRRTNDGRWIHTTCAMWIPELYYDHDQPIVVMDKLLKKRSTLV